MEKPQARAKIAVLIVHVEATDEWLFLKEKATGQWTLPTNKIVGCQRPFLVSAHRLVHLMDRKNDDNGNGDNISKFCTVSFGDVFVDVFISYVDFQRTPWLQRGISDFMWAKPSEFLEIPIEKVTDFARKTIEIIVETAIQMGKK